MYHTCESRSGHTGGVRQECLAHPAPCQRYQNITQHTQNILPRLTRCVPYGLDLCYSQLGRVARTGPSPNTRLSAQVPQRYHSRYGIATAEYATAIKLSGRSILHFSSKTACHSGLGALLMHCESPMYMAELLFWIYCPLQFNSSSTRGRQGSFPNP
jgi:hypothetical protein